MLPASTGRAHRQSADPPVATAAELADVRRLRRARSRQGPQEARPVRRARPGRWHGSGPVSSTGSRSRAPATRRSCRLVFVVVLWMIRSVMSRILERDLQVRAAAVFVVRPARVLLSTGAQHGQLVLPRRAAPTNTNTAPHHALGVRIGHPMPTARACANYAEPAFPLDDLAAVGESRIRRVCDLFVGLS